MYEIEVLPVNICQVLIRIDGLTYVDGTSLANMTTEKIGWIVAVILLITNSDIQTMYSCISLEASSIHTSVLDMN